MRYIIVSAGSVDGAQLSVRALHHFWPGLSRVKHPISRQSRLQEMFDLVMESSTRLVTVNAEHVCVGAWLVHVCNQ